MVMEFLDIVLLNLLIKSYHIQCSFLLLKGFLCSPRAVAPLANVRDTWGDVSKVHPNAPPIFRSVSLLLDTATKAWYNSFVSNGSGKSRKYSLSRVATSWGKMPAVAATASLSNGVGGSSKGGAVENETGDIRCKMCSPRPESKSKRICRQRLAEPATRKRPTVWRPKKPKSYNSIQHIIMANRDLIYENWSRTLIFLPDQLKSGFKSKF
uniref:Uncharacterized protein n=1 Tax=Romanomermis culicivorax TaxID=13658 RepID=A0A915L9X3_ROMCU